MVYERDRSKDEVNAAGMNVGYVRSSGVGSGVDAQKLGIQRVVEEQGGVVVYWYVDDGMSGASLDRPALQRMLADAESGHGGFPRVFVWSMNRLSRNPEDLVTICDRLTAAGALLVSVN